VGWVSSTADSNYSWRAALFENDIAIDLNTLIEPVPGWTLAEARSINDAGQIVGWGWQSVDGTDWNVMPQGFLLTPVPEPATLMLLTLALILRGRCR
ncbi:MAG TPA: PEP-CTERM sorting domain-containing protein, partial [Phycisphaerae bacterium]|nr:PEP-CTERM sorting domain-containing protein [Phycisphaerae bacterium]